jgi:hypothetical protein
VRQHAIDHCEVGHPKRGDRRNGKERQYKGKHRRQEGSAWRWPKPSRPTAPTTGDLADAALAQCRRYAEGEPPGEFLPPNDPLLDLACRHGRSLDWVLLGDPRHRAGVSQNLNI